MNSTIRYAGLIVFGVAWVYCLVNNPTWAIFLLAIPVYFIITGFPTNKHLAFAQKYRKLNGPSADPAEVKKYREEHPGVGVAEAAYEVKKAR